MTKMKGVVYDNQKYFYRFLKNEFKGDIIFDAFKKLKSFEDLSNNYSFMIFVIYSEIELLDLMKVYKKGVPLIICSFNINMMKGLKRIDDVSILDANKLKAEIIIDLKNVINFSNQLAYKE